MNMFHDGPIKLVKSDVMDDWYTIEKVEHDGRQEFIRTGSNSESFFDSARISDACVEGTAEEMRDIARAIRSRTRTSHKRCSVYTFGGDAHFRSPRNSQCDGVVPLRYADELADQIERELGEST